MSPARQAAATGKPALGRSRFAGVFLPTTLVALWQLFGGLGLLPDYLPAPVTVVGQYAQELASGDLLANAGASLYRVAAGFAIGTTAGVLLGLLSGISRVARTFFDPLISFSYPVPKIALLPVFMVWFGIGDTSKILVILLAVFYPAFINAYYGALAVPTSLRWVGRNMGASRWTIFRRIVVPAAAPQIFTGVRVALALSFVLLFSSELVSSRNGLGWMILFAEQFNRYDVMFVSIITIGILGFIADRALVATRRRVLHYLPDVQETYG